MSRISPELWTQLAREQARGEALRARRAVPDITERLIAALDSNGTRHLLVAILSTDVGIQDSQSRGVRVTTRELVVHDSELQRYLDITCHDAVGYEVFDLIGGELAERLSSGPETAPQVVTRVLAKWRRFWAQPPNQMLSREEQLGLFAELWFLSIWLIPRAGPVEAVNRWRGPFASRHDFEWPTHSIEVKASMSTRGRIHHINGLDQLAPPQQGEFLFFSLRLREEGSAANTLLSVVNACRQQLEAAPNALSLFERALAQVGYSPIYEDEYAKLRLRIVEEGLFEVRDDFPRLTVTQLIAGLPAGVEHVEYEINLGGFNHLCIARAPAEAPAL